mmetsp:Transcript_951/g.1497  ORF Transcript_951/g.1497 Transcript_951/m.1497 type:complete len:996 (+) Transcript_951:53-3040(+)
MSRPSRLPETLPLLPKTTPSGGTTTAGGEGDNGDHVRFRDRTRSTFHRQERILIFCGVVAAVVILTIHFSSSSSRPHSKSTRLRGKHYALESQSLPFLNGNDKNDKVSEEETVPPYTLSPSSSPTTLSTVDSTVSSPPVGSPMPNATNTNEDSSTLLSNQPEQQRQDAEMLGTTTTSPIMAVGGGNTSPPSSPSTTSTDEPTEKLSTSNDLSEATTSPTMEATSAAPQTQVPTVLPSTDSPTATAPTTAPSAASSVTSTEESVPPTAMETAADEASATSTDSIGSPTTTSPTSTSTFVDSTVLSETNTQTPTIRSTTTSTDSELSVYVFHATKDSTVEQTPTDSQDGATTDFPTSDIMLTSTTTSEPVAAAEEDGKVDDIKVATDASVFSTESTFPTSNIPLTASYDLDDNEDQTESPSSTSTVALTSSSVADESDDSAHVKTPTPVSAPVKPTESPTLDNSSQEDTDPSQATMVPSGSPGDNSSRNHASETTVDSDSAFTEEPVILSDVANGSIGSTVPPTDADSLAQSANDTDAAFTVEPILRGEIETFFTEEPIINDTEAGESMDISKLPIDDLFAPSKEIFFTERPTSPPTISPTELPSTEQPSLSPTTAEIYVSAVSVVVADELFAGVLLDEQGFYFPTNTSATTSSKKSKKHFKNSRRHLRQLKHKKKHTKKSKEKIDTIKSMDWALPWKKKHAKDVAALAEYYLTKGDALADFYNRSSMSDLPLPSSSSVWTNDWQFDSERGRELADLYHSIGATIDHHYKHVYANGDSTTFTWLDKDKKHGRTLAECYSRLGGLIADHYKECSLFGTCMENNTDSHKRQQGMAYQAQGLGIAKYYAEKGAALDQFLRTVYERKGLNGNTESEDVEEESEDEALENEYIWGIDLKLDEKHAEKLQKKLQRKGKSVTNYYRAVYDSSYNNDVLSKLPDHHPDKDFPQWGHDWRTDRAHGIAIGLYWKQYNHVMKRYYKVQGTALQRNYRDYYKAQFYPN